MNRIDGIEDIVPSILFILSIGFGSPSQARARTFGAATRV